MAAILRSGQTMILVASSCEFLFLQSIILLDVVDDKPGP